MLYCVGQLHLAVGMSIVHQIESDICNRLAGLWVFDCKLLTWIIQSTANNTMNNENKDICTESGSHY